MIIQEVMETKQLEIGRRLRRLRRERNLSQSVLAHLLEWKIPYLCNFEYGRWKTIDPCKLIQMADIFDITVDELMGHNENMYDFPR